MKTKTSLYTICFVFTCLLLQIGCEKKEEPPKPRYDSYISITPNLSWSSDNPIVIYSGDSLRYDIYVNPISRISEINFYAINTVTGLKELLIDSIIPNSIASGPLRIKLNYSLDLISKNLPFSLSLEVKETNGAPATYKSFGAFGSLSGIRSDSNIEISGNTCIMFDTTTGGIKTSTNYSEWRNYSILLPFLQSDSLTSGISTISYQAANDITLPKYKNYQYLTKFRIIGSDTVDFDKILTYKEIINVFTKSTDSVRVFKKNFPVGLIAAQIYTTSQDSIAAHKGIYTYALIRINSNIPKGSLKADIKTYNPDKFY